MLRYMLDTDICSYVMKRSHEQLLKRPTESSRQRCMHLSGYQIERKAPPFQGWGYKRELEKPSIKLLGLVYGSRRVQIE